MQDVGAPSNNAGGEGLAPVQSGVHTPGHHWTQEVVFPSDVTFMFGAGEAASEVYVETSLSNVSPEIFGLLVSFQVYQINQLKITFAMDRILRSTTDDDAGDAEIFACAPYTREFQVASNTNQQGLLSTLPGSTWTFVNSRDSSEDTGSVDNQRFIIQSVTPQYAMAPEGGTGINYSNRPLSIYSSEGIDTTAWRGFNLLLRRRQKSMDDLIAASFTIPTINRITITLMGIRLLRTVPALSLLGRDYLSAEVNLHRDSYYRRTQTNQGSGYFRSSQYHVTSSASPNKVCNKCNLNCSNEDPPKRRRRNKVARPTKEKSYPTRGSKKVSAVHKGKRGLHGESGFSATGNCELQRAINQQENQDRGYPFHGEVWEKMFRDSESVSPAGGEKVQISEVQTSQNIQD